jgi:hypothetical protein
MPGNLLMTEQGLLTQNLGEVAYLAANTSEPDSSLAHKATELLLDQKQADAMELLDQGLVAGQGDKAARELLIELLLEELRADYSNNRSRVPRIRELIEQTSADLGDGSDVALHDWHEYHGCRRDPKSAQRAHRSLSR